MFDTALPRVPTALPIGGLRALLRQLGSADSLGYPAPARTGRILLNDQVRSREGSIYLSAGRLYSVVFTKFVPPMATRLYTGGFLDEDQYRKLQAYPNKQVGPLAVKNGYVHQDTIDDINRQMILSSLTHLYGWADATWLWEPDVTSENFTIPGLEIMLMVANADERIGQWEALARNFPQVTKPNVVLAPGLEWNMREQIDPSPEMRRIASFVDGKMNVSKIATQCGFTRFEIAARLAKAVTDGTILLLDMDQVVSGSNSGVIENDELVQATAKVDGIRVSLAQAEQELERIRAKLGQPSEVW